MGAWSDWGNKISASLNFFAAKSTSPSSSALKADEIAIGVSSRNNSMIWIGIVLFPGVNSKSLVMLQIVIKNNYFVKILIIFKRSDFSNGFGK